MSTPRRSSRLNQGKPPNNLVRDYIVGSPLKELNISETTSSSSDELNATIVNFESSPVKVQSVRAMEEALVKLLEEVRVLREGMQARDEQADADRTARIELEREVASLKRSTADPNNATAVSTNNIANITNPQTNSSDSSSNASSEHDIDHLTVPQVPVDPASSSMVGNAARRVLDLPSFSGQPIEWPRFKAAFTQSTLQYGYTPLDNLFRLQKALKGDAEQCVASLLIYPHTVNDVIATFEEQFGHPEILVQSQIDVATSLPKISETKLQLMIPFAATVRNLAYFLDTPETKQHLSNPSLIKELSKKLPDAKRVEWIETASTLRPCPTVKDFSEWLTKKAKFIKLADLEQVSNSRTTQPNVRPPSSIFNNKRSNSRNTTLFANLHKPNNFKNVKCEFCNGNGHLISKCTRFLNLKISDRWDFVKDKHLCFTCLRTGHGSRTCHFRKQCDSCDRFHHHSLHDDSDEPLPNNMQCVSSTNTATSNKTTENLDGHVMTNNGPPASSGAIRKQNPFSKTNASNLHVVMSEPDLLFRILPVKLSGPSGSICTFALFDEGSSVTLIDETIANNLGLEGDTQSLHLQWFGNKSASEPSRKVSLDICGISEGYKSYKIHNVSTIRNISLPLQTIQMSSLHSKHRHLKNLPICDYLNASPKILIGLDNCHLGLPTKTCAGEMCEPVAAKTKLGWLIYGPRPRNDFVGHNRAVVLHQTDTGLDEINRIVQEYFTTENFGVAHPRDNLESVDDKHARTILEDTTVRIGNRFQTGLLWKPNTIKLPDSRPMAVKRLYSIENKMRRCPQFSKMYAENIEQYIAKGYARELSAEEESRQTDRTWYLPHFGVVNPHKPDKLRIVFDAAAMVDGESLNSVLLKGPDQYSSLIKILFRFRIGQIGICGDIREMFHQIRIQPEDQDAQRFLWRNGDQTRSIKTFVMNAMVFGATCSPCSAQFVKDKNADEHADIHPAAVQAIKHCHYVDDYVTSFDTPYEAIEVTNAVVNIHRKAGFELRNFVSNHPDVLANIGCAAKCEQPLRMQPDSDAEKILGMYWDTNSDSFLFQTRFHKIDPEVMIGKRRPTKRELLSVAMSVFDPFGILADFMIFAKVMIQDLWKTGTGWDEQIPDDIYARWTLWHKELRTTNTVSVPRCYSPHLSTSTAVELHIFADSSETAFAAVGYWRVKRPDNAFDVSFIAGKTKCAPKKLLSVPRLELQAAVLATRLRTTIRSCHDIPINQIFMWSDSKTVVQWIKSDHRRYKPFVAHRVAEILEETDVNSWRWIPTAINVADDATRVNQVPKIHSTSRWLMGPDFLYLDKDQWPVNEIENLFSDTEEEIRSKFANHHCLIVSSFLSNLDRYSTYVRARRVYAWIKRFIANSRAKRNGKVKQIGELDANELHEAEIHLVRDMQEECFASEIADLKSKAPLNKSSNLRQLMPYLDQHGILRVDSRIRFAKCVSIDATRPIILDKNHRLTHLIVDHFHRQMHHQNEDAIICAIRTRFWVPHIRTMVRKTRRNCQWCKIRFAKTTTPVMGALPDDRLTPFVRPFTFTGLDYFGPLYVTIGRRREKRWVALFTCLTIRAVHLELAADLSTDSCILCIKNFVNIRGVPKRIRSDNGTNFIGVANEFRNEVNIFDQDTIRANLAEQGIDWVFNCPSDPEAGGCWERLVQSIKKVLAVTLREQAPRVETLRSLLLEAANIVNSRPLTHIPVSPDNNDPLTPNHFLVGSVGSTQSPGEIDNKMLCMRKQWRVAQQLKNQFWHRWISEYLPVLTRRTKWHTESKPIAVGDLVIICDQSQSRNSWRRGIIEQLFTGRDGRVRSANVRTNDGVLRRPTRKLAVLEVERHN